MLAHRALRFDSLPSKLWRDWLQNDAEKVKEYTGKSACGRRRAYVMNLFRQYFPDELSQLPAKEIIFWYAQSYSSPQPLMIIRQIAWEVLEVAFRVEILELDQYLVPSTEAIDDATVELFRQNDIARVFSDGQFMRPNRKIGIPGHLHAQKYATAYSPVDRSDRYFPWHGGVPRKLQLSWRRRVCISIVYICVLDSELCK